MARECKKLNKKLHTWAVTMYRRNKEEGRRGTRRCGNRRLE